MNQGKRYSLSQVNLRELSSRLLSLTENTSYTLTQINGQRIYRKTAEAWNGPEPSRKCEVFIGRIPHDCFEDTLVPLLMRAGELFEFRLMINFSGWNRGYAFAMYTSADGAKNAVTMLDNYMIRPSWLLGVCPSVNNCRLFISRISPSLSSAEIVMILYDLTEEVKEVRIRRTSSSCAAIVEYKSHRGAAMARKALVSMATTAWGAGARPLVDWSQPESPKQLLKYREIGTWSPERGLELYRVSDSPNVISNGSLGHTTPSYTLEPWCQARRMRLIQEAQRASNPLLTAYFTSTSNTGFSPALPGSVFVSSAVPNQVVMFSPTAAPTSTSFSNMSTPVDGFYSALSAASMDKLSSISPVSASMETINGMPSPIPASTPTPGYDAALPYPSQTAQYSTNLLDTFYDNNTWKSVVLGNTNKFNWGGLGLDPAERLVWAPPPQNSSRLPAKQFNPWTARLPLDLDSVGPHSESS